MLTIHHLQRSQSERIIWLCEELGVPYELKNYQRAPAMAPAEYKALHPIGTAPIITDGSLTLGESGAIVEYIIHKYGGGRLALPPSHTDWVEYLYWFHFANGTLQPAVSRGIMFRILNVPEDNPFGKGMEARTAGTLKSVDDRLAKAQWLAGDEFSAADIMSVFSLTTMRVFNPMPLTDYPNIVAYLKRVGERKAYRTAMEKGDPGFEPVLYANAPEPFNMRL